MLVYTDDRQRDYRLQNCNGYEVYRIDYNYGKYSRRYQVYKQGENGNEGTLEYFATLKEARAFARAN